MKELIFLIVWVAGVVIAKGFWWTVGAIFIPFLSWYLVIERGLQMLGWV